MHISAMNIERLWNHGRQNTRPDSAYLSIYIYQKSFEESNKIVTGPSFT
jgi:hypothetical protein